MKRPVLEPVFKKSFGLKLLGLVLEQLEPEFTRHVFFEYCSKGNDTFSQQNNIIIFGIPVKLDSNYITHAYKKFLFKTYAIERKNEKYQNYFLLIIL